MIECEKTLTHAEVEQFSQFMQHEYRYTLYLDGLPSAATFKDQTNYMDGVPVGYYDHGSKVIYNHLDIVVSVHNTMEGH